MAPYPHKPVLAPSQGSFIVVLGLMSECVGYTILQAAKDLVMVTLNKSFCVLLANMWKKPVHIPKSMSTVHLTDSPEHIVAIEADPPQTILDTIGAVYYKASRDRDRQMTRHEVVKAKDDQKL